MKLYFSYFFRSQNHVAQSFMCTHFILGHFIQGADRSFFPGPIWQGRRILPSTPGPIPSAPAIPSSSDPPAPHHLPIAGFPPRLNFPFHQYRTIPRRHANATTTLPSLRLEGLPGLKLEHSSQALGVAFFWALAFAQPLNRDILVGGL